MDNFKHLGIGGWVGGMQTEFREVSDLLDKLSHRISWRMRERTLGVRSKVLELYYERENLEWVAQQVCELHLRDFSNSIYIF